MVDWNASFRAARALWEYNETEGSEQPHVQLTSGMHAGVYYHCPLYLRDLQRAQMAAEELVKALVATHATDLPWVTCVAGPRTGGAMLAEQMAVTIRHRIGTLCRSVSLRKYDSGTKRRMVLEDPNRYVRRGAVVLVCDDAFSTAGSFTRSVDACLETGATVLPLAPALVNRSGMSHIEHKGCSYATVALIERTVPMWSADECPYCMKDSPAISPKDNWVRLVGRAAPHRPTSLRDAIEHVIKGN